MHSRVSTCNIVLPLLYLYFSNFYYVLFPRFDCFGAQCLQMITFFHICVETACRASRASRVERVEPCCSTSSTQPKCMGSTRRTCVVSRRDEPSVTWALPGDIWRRRSPEQAELSTSRWRRTARSGWAGGGRTRRRRWPPVLPARLPALDQREVPTTSYSPCWCWASLPPTGRALRRRWPPGQGRSGRGLPSVGRRSPTRRRGLERSVNQSATLDESRSPR